MRQSTIIIGAGIIGAATALQLARAGHDVRVINGGGPGATAAAFGWVNASFYLDEDHHHLRAAGIAAWHRVLQDVHIAVTWPGCLCWDMSDDEMHKTYDKLRNFDYPVEQLTRAQVAAREPALVLPPKQALFFPSEGATASDAIAGQFLQAAQDHGAQLINALKVQALIRQNDRVIGVKTAQGNLLADQVIIAAGTGTAELAASIGVDLPLVPRPAYILRSQQQPQLLHHILATPAGEIRQEPSGHLLMPTSVAHQSDSAATLTLSPDVAADQAIERLRQIVKLSQEVQWAEVTLAGRPVPEDGLPIIGAIAPGAYAAVLHSGITLGPIVAELVAADLAGRLDNSSAALLAPYRPDRFIKH